MKARRKSDGRIIEVSKRTAHFIDESVSEQFYVGNDGAAYLPSDLDFDVEEAEQTESAVISGWVARDRLNNALFLHDEKPYRAFSGYQTDGKEDEWRSNTCPPYPIDYDSFPSLTWESEPLEVDITIKAKKK